MNATANLKPRVEMRSIGKSFPGVRALSSVDFTLYPGEVHALLGENGAGKSTLIKILTGALSRDAGEIRLDGKPVSFNSTGEAQAHGISTVYQEVNLIPAMSVTKNLALGPSRGALGVISWGKARKRARGKLSRLKLNIDTEQPVGSFSVAVQQLVAIAHALDDDTSVLVLDEPTASLDAQETATLFGIVSDLKARAPATPAQQDPNGRAEYRHRHYTRHDFSSSASAARKRSSSNFTGVAGRFCARIHSTIKPPPSNNRTNGPSHSAQVRGLNGGR